jgi:3-deoxy-D-manno-octulosonic-acid transferase
MPTVSYVLNLIYVALLLLLSPYFVYQAIWRHKYRHGFAAKFLGFVPWRRSDRLCVWLHAVSVGEVNLLGPLVAEIERRHPDWECVVSSTTLTGLALAKTRYPQLSVFYCPLDFTWAVNTAMRRVCPDLLVLAELELWPNLVAAARRFGAPVAIVNGRLSDRSFRGYRLVRPVISRVLGGVDLVAAQTPEYARRFAALGADPEKIRVIGSLKFDGALTDRGNAQTVRLRKLAGFTSDDVIFLAGSTQAPEEELALATYRALLPQWPRLRLVLVPRHPQRFDEVAALLDKNGLPWQRRSTLSTTADPLARVLLVDSVGELGAWWGTTDIAFVGGSLTRRGGQNMLEPAAYGAAVSFGPNTWNFRDMVAELLAAEAAQVVHGGPELTQFVRRCLEDPAWTAALGRRAKALIARQLGATAKTVDLLEALLPAPNGSTSSLRTAA